MPRRINRATVVAGLGATALMAVAACGSSPGSPAASGGGGDITIGIIGPMTGARADVGKGMTVGAQLALKEINDHGGVLGRHVNLVVQDDAGDPGDAVPAAQKEIQSDNVSAIVGPTALTASVVLPLIDRANIPMLMWGGGSAFDKMNDPHFFRMSPSDTQQAYAMVVYAHNKGWNKVALAVGNTSADQSLSPGIVEAAKKLGMTITSQVTITIGSTSFRSEISNLMSGQPQAVLAQFDIPSAGVLFGQLAQQGLSATPWVASNLWYANEFYKSVGAAGASGPVYIVNPAAGSLGEPHFLEVLKAEKGRSAPNNGEEVMYDGTITWALGVAKAGTLSMPDVGKGIVAAANGPGTACGDYATCLGLIKAGTPTDWQGAASSVDFDQYHNVFGGFDILHYNADGTTAKADTLTPKQLETALAG